MHIFRMTLKFVQPLFHLVCRFVGKRYGKYLRRVHAALLNEIKYSVCKHARFARARACKHHRRSHRSLYRRKLRLIEIL